MKENKISVKYRILLGMISGLIFATLMVLFDLWGDKSFSMVKFLIHFFFFGFFMELFMKNKYTE